MKLSVVVPIYNSERFISECLESILNQSFHDYEIILIDDGSVDNSLAICTKFCQRYPNVRLFHEENGGAAKARNMGIKYAKGNYIYFVDSDDVMCSNALKEISDDFNYGYDMIFGNFISWDYINSKKEIWDDITEIDIDASDSIGTFCEKYARSNGQIPWNPYQAFYKRKILVDHNLKFNEKFTVGEDCDFFFEYIKYVKTFKVENSNLVLYRIVNNSNSLIRSYNCNNIMSQLVVFKKLYDKSYYFNNEELMKKYFATRFTNVVILIGNISKMQDRDTCIAYVQKNIDMIYQTTSGVKYRMLQCICKAFGLKVAISVTSSIRRVVTAL